MLSETSYFLSLTLDTIHAEDVVKLRDIIQYHRACYYADKPVISDREFDQLYALLVASEAKFHMSHDALSPTQEIARLEDNHFTKAKHLHQMTSLDNTYNAEDLSEFEIRMLRILEKERGENRPLLEYIIEYKFDGLGIALLYEK